MALLRVRTYCFLNSSSSSFCLCQIKEKFCSNEEVFNIFPVPLLHCFFLYGWNDLFFVSPRFWYLSAIYNFFSVLPEEKIASLILKEVFHRLVREPILDFFVNISFLRVKFVFLGTCRSGIFDHVQCVIKTVREFEFFVVLFGQFWHISFFYELLQGSKDLSQDRYIANNDVSCVATLVRLLTFASSFAHFSRFKRLVHFSYKWDEYYGCLRRDVECKVRDGLRKAYDLSYKHCRDSGG